MTPAPGHGGLKLGGKIGGLPTWAWGLVILGGLGVGLYLRKRGSSPTSAGTPVSTGSILGAAGGGASDGSGTAGVAVGIDPYLAQLVGDSNNALVNESAILAGLTGQSVDAALGAAQTTLGFASDLFSSSRTVAYQIGSSPAGSSLAGTSTPPPSAAAQSPATPYPAYSPPAELVSQGWTPTDQGSPYSGVLEAPASSGLVGSVYQPTPDGGTIRIPGQPGYTPYL